MFSYNKDKLGLNEFQFEEFRRIYEAKLSGQSVEMSRVVAPHRHTNLMEKTEEILVKSKIPLST